MLFPRVTVTDNQGLLSRSYSIAPAEFSPVAAHLQCLTAPYPTLGASAVQDRKQVSPVLHTHSRGHLTSSLFNFRDRLFPCNLISSWEKGGWREEQAVHCRGGGWQRCPEGWPALLTQVPAGKSDRHYHSSFSSQSENGKKHTPMVSPQQ